MCVSLVACYRLIVVCRLLCNGLCLLFGVLWLAVGCYLFLCVDWCLLFDVCCSVYATVVRYSLFVSWCCCLLFAACCMIGGVCFPLFDFVLFDFVLFDVWCPLTIIRLCVDV